MKKISTLFERDMNQGGRIVNKYSSYLPDFPGGEWTGAIATEKLDGTNVRITVRNNTLVRLEKRRNPSNLEKAKGIVEPWYMDASEYEPGDKYIWEAARNTDLTNIEDGEKCSGACPVV